MAVVQHASTPAVVRSANSSTSATLTTAAFSPPAGSILLAMYGIEYDNAFSQTQYVTTWNCTGASDWRLAGSPYWDSPPKEGQYSTFGNNVALYTFNYSNMQSVLSGATITKVEVYLSRQSTGGNSSAVNAILWTNQITTLNTGTPNFSNVNAVGTYGGFAWGTSMWFTVPNSMGTNFQNGTALGLQLWDTNADATNYSLWNSNAAIRITYTKTGATPAIAISDTGPNSWGSARINVVDNGARHGIMSCWTQQIVGAPGSITVTATRSVDTSAAAFQLAVIVMTGQAATQTSAMLTSAHATTSTTLEATKNIQAGSLVYCQALADLSTPALTKTSNLTERDAWTNTTDTALLRVGGLTSATTVTGNVTFGWTTTDTAATKVFQGIEILTGVTVVTFTEHRFGYDSLSIQRAVTPGDSGTGTDTLAVVLTLKDSGHGTDSLQSARQLFDHGACNDTPSIGRTPLTLWETGSASDYLGLGPDPHVIHGLALTKAVVSGRPATTSVVQGVNSAVPQTNATSNTSRVGINGQTSAVVV